MGFDSNTDRAKKFTRRAFVIGAGQGLLLSVLGGRLAWLQVAQGEKYKSLAENNRINVKMLAPSRGHILDRFGEVLATNEQDFRVVVVPEQTDDLESALRQLQKLISLDEKNIKKILKEAGKQAKFIPLEIKNNLDWEDVAKVEVSLPDLPGMAIDVGEIRHYPLKEATAHLVGYVAAVNKSEIGDDPVLTLPGVRIGKTGIEKACDQKLRGKSGSAEVEVNVAGREVRELQRDQSQQGEHIKLTIDAALQAYVQERLSQERSASAVIMDVHTGAIYALSSHPSFDPNMFTRGMDVQTWEELLSNPGHPLNNKAVAGQYPPGSTFKMVTALAALKYGMINENTIVHCPGHYEYGGDRFHCWKTWGHGPMNLLTALEQSCDTYFYKISTEIGIDRIAEMAHLLGLGSKYDFALKEERPGLMPDKKWKLGHFGDSWRPGETIVASIGQGYIQATPLQLAVMTSRLVNGGYAVEPWIIEAIGNGIQPAKKGEKIGFHKWHLNLVKRGMDRVVNSEKGTALAARIMESNMAMGGKTGTAQVRRISKKQRQEGTKQEDLPWKFRHHALFVGYAPVKDPRYACAVVVEHGGSGSGSAAPVARDLLYQTQKQNPLRVRG